MFGSRCIRILRPAVALTGGAAIAAIASLVAADSTAAESPAVERVDYVRDVRPILASRCAKCHSESFKQEGGLKLDSPSAIAKGGESGPLFTAGKSGESRLLERVTAEGAERMPPEGPPLAGPQIEVLRRWIDQGAELPANDAPLRHWALEPPVAAPAPAVRDATRVRGPIDAWLQVQREAQSVAVVEAAPKQVFVRRLYLDLVGLPPTEEQAEEFAVDQSPDAVERLTDRLLASPAYGERWGRHWMDVWRYSDWDGYGAEVRESQPHIWRWRDWIIESLNADRPYQRMVAEMLAADELAPDDPSTLRATGFLVRNWFKFNRNVWLDNTIEHTGKAFLGLTLNCARCHDHMYDSIKQSEYYSLRAIFEPYDIRTDRLPGQADVAKDGLVRAYDAKLDATTFLFTRGDEKQPVKDKPIEAAIPAWLAGGNPITASRVELAPQAYYPGSQSFVHEETLAAARAELAKATAAQQAAQQSLAASRQERDVALAQLAKAAAAQSQPDAKPAPKEDEKREEPKVVWTDAFQAARDELWTKGAGEFVYADGRLHQRQPLDAMCGITSQTPHPRDFVVKFRFKITGGKVYRSMGLSFDAVGEQDRNFVYLSAYTQGPKVQAAHRRGGSDEYPPQAQKPLPIEVGREYELAVSVRDSLINVAVDGQLQLVHRAPSRSADGRVLLWTYDATGEFIQAELATLPKHVPLVDEAGMPTLGDAKPTPQSTMEMKAQQAELAAQAADKHLAASQASLVAVEARVAADKASYATPPSADAKLLAIAAVKAERTHAVLAAETKLLDAQAKLLAAKLALGGGDAKAQAAAQTAATAAEKPVADAQKALDAARMAATQESDQYTRFGPTYPTASTGRRRALAEWITSDQNPLAPRVAVNHMWLRHFGSPLVPTVFEFGANGQPPTHPALLDWLARTFVVRGWSMKSLHRELATSEAFRLASSTGRADDPNRVRDPENRWYWRMNPRRMEAELVRDATLAVAGNLQHQFSGPDLDPNQGLTLGRRSVYFRTSKEKKMTFLALFDSANVSECYRRSESIAPQQALAMVNSALTLAQARLLAGELSRSLVASAEGADGLFVEAAYRRVLGRAASEAERAECEKFLAAQSARFRDPKGLNAFAGGGDAAVKPSADPSQRARENLVHVLLNHNDFVTIR